MRDERDAARDDDVRPIHDDDAVHPAIGAWLGRAISSDPESAVWRDERFLAWLQRTARAGATQRTTVARLEARGDELQARALAHRHGVRWSSRRPSYKRVAFDGTPADAVDFGRTRGVSPLVELGVAAGVGRELWDEPVEQWIVIPDGVPAGQHLSLKIVGESMSPLMHTGDTVLVRVGGELAERSIVVARHPEDGYLCKVVHRVRARSIELASLQAGRPRIVIPRDPALVVGTVLMVWCPHRAQ